MNSQQLARGTVGSARVGWKCGHGRGVSMVERLVRPACRQLARGAAVLPVGPMQAHVDVLEVHLCIACCMRREVWA